MCTEPWHKETVLCQAVEGNWLARQLVKAKLHEADADHCDPESTPGGCQHTPCESKGLSKVLLGVADGWGSPLNNRMSGVYYALLPLRKRLRALLRGMAHGKLPLSQLDRELRNLPLVERQFLRSKHTTLEWIMHEHVYPIIRTWGVVIGGERTRPARPHECPATLETLLSTSKHHAGGAWPWQKTADDVMQGLGHMSKAAEGLTQAAAGYLLGDHARKILFPKGPDGEVPDEQ